MSAPNVAGDLDITGPYAAAGPDMCRDACPLAGTEHTEDQCVGICIRCGHEPDDPRQIVNGLCHDCDWLEDHPHHTRRTA